MKKNIVCKRIRQLRVLKGISQEYMAEELEITQPNYAKLEAQDSRINVERLQIIAKILEVNLTDLLSKAPIPDMTKLTAKSERTSIRRAIDFDSEHVKFLKEEISFLRELLNK